MTVAESRPGGGGETARRLGAPTPEAVRIDAALNAIHTAVENQLGVEQPLRHRRDPANLVRFSDQLPDRLAPEIRADLEVRAGQLGPWLQGPFLLGGDLLVGADRGSDGRWLALEHEVPADLRGARILDVGSNAGYDAFMFARRGADYVLACEPRDYHHQALFLDSIYRSGVDFQQLDWRSLDPRRHGRFDIVHCNGVLHRDTDPLGLLGSLRSVLADDGTALVGSMMLADPEVSEYMRFVPGTFLGDPTWWMVPGRLALRWMCHAVGLSVEREFGEQDGPAGDFRVINAYQRCLPRDPVIGRDVELHGAPA